MRVSPRIGFRTPQVEDCKESTHEGEETGTRILEGPALFIRLSSFLPLSLSSFPPFPASFSPILADTAGRSAAGTIVLS